MTPDRTIEGVVLLNTVEQRIRELWTYRQWCRRQRNSALWTPLRIEYDQELRALVGLLRRSRAAAAPIVEREDDFYAGMPA